MIAGGTGGAVTTANGTAFEEATDFAAMMAMAGFVVREDGTYWKDGEQIGILASKRQMRKRILLPNGVRILDVLSGELIPDEALFIRRPEGYVLRIIEKKFQKSTGSADEKLQCGPFKLHQYRKLAAALSEKMGVPVEAEFHFLLCEWFKSPKYADAIAYNREHGIRCAFGTAPAWMFV